MVTRQPISAETLIEVRRLAQLTAKLKHGFITESEESELETLLTKQRVYQTGFDALNDSEQYSQLVNDYEYFLSEAQNELKTKIAKTASVKSYHRIHFLKTAWVRYAAAIIIVFGIAAYLWNTQTKETPAITKTENPVPSQNDVAPGGNKAVLTLADGRRIVLDSALTGQIASEGGSVINKTKDGQIIYTVESTTFSKPVAYNVMSTPRGGQYQVALPDGSRVWLNAESSITYPTIFIGKERNVSITGEVYFEVSKNDKLPFIVSTPKDKIIVLGTSFNVNAYPDEPYSKTSLLEGSVKINNKVLKPGHAYINGEVVKTDLLQDIAWKNGAFSFDNTDLEVVMRQFSRWYDVEVVYEKPQLNKKISGDIGRDLNLSQVLKGLQGLGVKTKIEGRRLLVDIQ